MIKCNQCGKISAAGTTNCQFCGASLSITIDGGMSPKPTPLEQPELPAWLESLRAGERPASPTNTATNFSAADFVDEGSLPSWMRAERNEARDNTGATPPVSVRPSSLPHPTTEGENQPSTGIAARSLLDEQALPVWLRESRQSDPVPTQEKIAASSLVQPENMPDWMKSLQRDDPSFSGQTGRDTFPSGSLSTSSPQIPAAPQWAAGGSPAVSQPVPSPVTPAVPAGQSGFSARDLIDPQALPSWMVQQGERVGSPAQSSQPASPQPSAGRPPAVSQPVPSPVTPAVPAGQSGFSARDLIDPQALPSWMVQQGERVEPPAQSLQAPQPRAVKNTEQPIPRQTFPASSLLDMNSLPTWLREREQGGTTQGDPNLLANQSFLAPATNPAAPAFGGNIPASSFLDPNVVPEWLRQADTQQPQSGFGPPPQYHQPVASHGPVAPQPNIYAGPPRVENVRVPNRPRNEINPNETSEVAANVFSSMLGVASSAPSYPMSSSQPQSSYQQPRAPGHPAQPNTGYPMSQSGMPTSGAANYAGSSMGAMPHTPNIASNAPQGYAASNSYGSSHQGGMSSSQMGNSPSAGTPYGSNTAPSREMAVGAANEQKSTKKRGLFGAIFEWLTR